MSLSLIGIIAIQAYYINDSVNNEKERFKFNVIKALNYVSNTIEENESEQYFSKFLGLDSEKKADEDAVSQLLIYQKNNSTKEMFVYRGDVLEENYKLTSSLFDIGLDSIDIKNITTKSTTEIYSGNGDSDKDIKSPISKIIRSGSIDEAQRLSFERGFKEMRKTYPIHKRVSENEIKKLLTEKLKKDDIDIDFEFAIYSNNLATKVKSDNFEYDPNSSFKVPIFYDENNQTPYRLHVNFPDDRKFILSGVIGMILLSITFTSIIILAYSSALFQLVKQRKISEIKTDFINNMTHEFKTPIATINLAIDSIKNPKIIDDKEKVLRYLGMIKEENKRMHAQVENVLRISKLEKNELNISKDRVDLHDLVEDALTHVELIVEDRQGYIKTFLDAETSSVLANETHFTNVIVNILDNAIKYSPEAPKIEVYTENAGTNILLKIKDYGSGMSKAAAKRVFEKFYREHTGNIHNVKGHGLGLAYVKRIVEDHQGHVSVESEKDKGSTFIIKLPLIS
ncbi:HAMP domain-containing histidine kinase [Algibacter amylolyticus]|uniref:histidine kinase n=1 Tax=Algibacter amylolyticus TaxID=1608400 RepID=A0A5M7B900_9FLAO|nr:HAMP domain-containing sensor histidine kinase [Algibacter amylolyticus]KAA5824727.1 HAMP domain-containing histidine kinase [Algibacter amylolyticus]MBB5268840.1 two-component system phosphate regulon sensor histidine kinase PhoR [Algibacter amylolyticus]TSJ75892.1 HAMP domain-containing histidine kinase [Algibacter amylolyticus]